MSKFKVCRASGLGLQCRSKCYLNPLFLETTCSASYDDPAAEVIEEVLSSLAKGDCDLGSPCIYPQPYPIKDGEWFDFIIVGAGSAGCVIANRLSEVHSWRILLLEVGGYPTKTSEIPSFNSQLQLSDIDWQYKTSAEEPNCLGCKGRRCNWPRGKVLGGSSTINNIHYIRGNAKDYDQWEADGCEGWGYKDVLPYFKKSEDMRSPGVQRSPEFFNYHGVGGFLKVEDFNTDFENPLANVLAAGMNILGYPINLDTNGRVQSGFNKFVGTIEDGRRCNSAKAFLSPITCRENLKLVTEVLVSRILIDKKEKIANGVEFIGHNGKMYNVFAKKEVIISAGSINTPQLLMLSGIGPQRHLNQFGIKVIADLPVGLNLQDHPLGQGLIMTVNYPKPTINKTLEEDMIRFLLNKKSRLSSIGMYGFNIFINTENSADDWPDVDLLFTDFAKNDTLPLMKLLNNIGFIDEIKHQYFEINVHSYIVLLISSLLKPYSRGRIELYSRDPRHYPKITAGYFSDPRDVDTLAKAYKIFYNFAETEPLKAIGAKIHEVKIPACLKFPLMSREYRDCFVRHLHSTQYHPVGTCRMGSPRRRETVVDPTLRVLGVNGLRVIDASVMPFVIRGNTNAPTTMIGEKGSDLIKGFWITMGNRTPYNRMDHFRNIMY